MSTTLSSLKPLAVILTVLQIGGTSSASLINRQSNTSISAPTVSVLNGTYYGNYLSTYDEDVFLGIPFAQPPVGDLRFRQAQSLNTTWSEAKNATEYSPECYGYGSDDWVLGNYLSEDCLTLNVVRPSGTSPDAKLPIGVWIHGGGSYEGGGSDPRYNLSFIVQQSVYARSPIIGVSIQYRLSGFGWMYGTEILRAGLANIGIRDQRLALHWIQENIAAFGGDPEKVTIWGESAGASGVGGHLVAYGGRDDGLFRAAITESGGPTGNSRYSTPEAWDANYNKITSAANCSTANDTIACLRTLPIETLSNVLNSSATTGISWSKQIDNDLFTTSGTKQVLAGQFVKVPHLTGRNHDEGSMFGTKGINTTEQFLAMVRSAGIDNSTALTLAALYPDIPAIGIPATLHGRPSPANASLGVQYKRSAAYGGDLAQHAPRRLVSQAWAKYNVSSYSYHFNVWVNGLPDYIGVTHFQEVAFVFANIQGLGYENAVAVNPFAGKPETYPQLARMMSRMWISFIVDLDPNNSGVSCVDWPEYTLDNPRNIVFDTNVTGLAYVEPDIYRAEAIQYIVDRLATAYGR